MHAQTNRVLHFDGSLLHGVIPGREEATDDGHDNGGERMTLMIGWWLEDVSQPRPRASVGPNMPTPAASKTLTWPKTLADAVCEGVGGVHCEQVSTPMCLSPVWQDVAPEPAPVDTTTLQSPL